MMGNSMHSLLTQTVRDLEIIMVDAGSSDKTYEICSGYMSMYSNVKLIQIDKVNLCFTVNNNTFTGNFSPLA